MKEQITADAVQNGKSIDHRRKRVTRIKTFIIIVTVLCLILPSVFCVILELQVIRLQNQMEELISIHSEYGLHYDSNGNIDYAYAAEKPADAESGRQDETIAMTASDQSGDRQTGEDQTGDGQAMEDRTGDDQSDTAASKDSGADKPQPDDVHILPDLPYNNADISQNEQQKDGIYTGKTVYLTFDDGPSIYTDEILDILEEYHVKATFFVIGKTDEDSKAIYKRIVDEGHTLGMHSYSHKYDIIYNSVKDFDKDFTKLWKLLYDTTGYEPSIYRFPGGSDNLVNRNGMEDFISYLNDKSIVYFDWNVVNGDATSVKYSKDQLIDNVLGGVALKKISIVLMHDSQSKKETVDSLHGLLDELTRGGAQMLPLDKDVSPIQMIKADSVK